MSQKDLVLSYLKEHGSITSWDCIMQLKCTRLSEYIRQLKHDDNLPITPVWETNGKKRWVRYFLNEK